MMEVGVGEKAEAEEGVGSHLAGLAGGSESNALSEVGLRQRVSCPETDCSPHFTHLPQLTSHVDQMQSRDCELAEVHHIRTWARPALDDDYLRPIYPFPRHNYYKYRIDH